jgi:hypothetical protein
MASTPEPKYGIITPEPLGDIMTPERLKWALDRTKHGGYLGGKERPEHYTWRMMLARCQNHNSAAYQYYGAKGIKVCKRWHKYENFLADMGERPSSAHSLDRIDTHKGYSPANCRWATRSEQQKNKSTTRRYTNGSFTGTLVECAKYLGISKELANMRWKKWGSFEKEVIWQERPRAR